MYSPYSPILGSFLLSVSPTPSLRIGNGVRGCGLLSCRFVHSVSSPPTITHSYAVSKVLQLRNFQRICHIYCLLLHFTWICHCETRRTLSNSYTTHPHITTSTYCQLIPYIYALSKVPNRAIRRRSPIPWTFHTSTFVNTRCCQILVILSILCNLVVMNYIETSAPWVNPLYWSKGTKLFSPDSVYVFKYSSHVRIIYVPRYFLSIYR